MKAEQRTDESLPFPHLSLPIKFSHMTFSLETFALLPFVQDIFRHPLPLKVTFLTCPKRKETKLKGAEEEKPYLFA